MVAVLIAQFLSAAADNALLFATLALLKSRLYPAWTEPLLQEFFVAAVILLVPFSGRLADGWPKGRVMLLANALKLLGASSILLGVSPFIAYGVVGVGAAFYAPAKYGILSDLTSAERLVQANGLMESSTIAAILIGAITGGTLADWDVQGALLGVMACYALAGIINLFIPRIAATHVMAQVSPLAMLRAFAAAWRRLYAVVDARFAVAGTSLFWGAGSTMRFLLIAWTPLALGITTNREPAYLNAVVAVGIVLGAGLAGKLVTLRTANRALAGGVLLGLAVCLLSMITRVQLAYAALLLAGAGGGFLVVPLNALLQKQGHESVGAGYAVAVQNGMENLTMLMMLGLYIGLSRLGVPVQGLAAAFGGAQCAAMLGLWMYRVRKQRTRALLCQAE
jgi:MFS transporter, LPLT family, lysophospholipid transporter